MAAPWKSSPMFDRVELVRPGSEAGDQADARQRIADYDEARAFDLIGATQRQPAVIREQIARDALTLVEGGAPDPAVCAHDDVRVFEGMGSTVSGDETFWGQCRGCAEWVICDVVMGGATETRVMTAAERARAQASEDQRRREEWDV